MLKNGFLTFCCAFIPGAGQMYQGYMKRGLSLILTACLIGMVSSLLNPVLLLVVVVWMYSFFDTFNLRAQIIADTAPEDDYLIHFDPRDKRLARALLDSHKLVGWLLIAFGALIAYQNLIMNTVGDLVYRWGHSSPVFRAFTRRTIAATHAERLAKISESSRFFHPKRSPIAPASLTSPKPKPSRFLIRRKPKYSAPKKTRPATAPIARSSGEASVSYFSDP